VMKLQMKGNIQIKEIQIRIMNKWTNRD
jgi:hypothetical protein